MLLSLPLAGRVGRGYVSRFVGCEADTAIESCQDPLPYPPRRGEEQIEDPLRIPGGAAGAGGADDRQLRRAPPGPPGPPPPPPGPAPRSRFAAGHDHLRPPP